MAFAVLTVLVVVAYAPALGGGFLFDDFYSIADNPFLRAIGTPIQSWIGLALSSDTGMLRRPISMLAFGANVAFFGMNPAAFKAVNLAIHLVNGWLLFALGRRLAPRLLARTAASTQTDTLALIAAGLWLLHPLNVSSVVYVVQRMNELATLFILLGLLGYADARERLLRGQSGLLSGLLSLCIFGLLATFSKENGALIVAYALAIEAICYRFNTAPSAQSGVLKAFFALTVFMPLAMFAAYLTLHPHWLTDSYSVRTFTLSERLLTEPRILSDYLLWTFVPNPAWMGFYHDDIRLSHGLFDPPSTVLAISFLLVLAGAAIKLHRTVPGFAFAIAWFLVGHAMESTILPLELVFEHRQYLPMAGLLLGVVCACAQFVPARWPARAVGAGVAVLLLIVTGLTAVRAATWGDPLVLAMSEARHHPASSRAQYEAGRALIVTGAANGQRGPAEQAALPYFRQSASLDENQIHPVTETLLIRAQHEPIAPAAISELAERLRRVPSYTQANAFLDLLVRASETSLMLTPDNMSQLVDAALANPHFPPKVRAMIMNNYGAYQFNIVHDQQGAISWTLAAAAEDPKNPYFQLNLAKIALAVKQPDKAGEYLDAATQLNQVGMYDKEIDALQRQISQ